MSRRSSLVWSARCACFAVASIGMAAACTSFDGESVPENDGGALDATPDATAEEASSPDGGGEASSVDADAGWIPCANRPVDPLKFCDDFDHTQRIDFRWSAKSLVGTGTLDASANAVSAPRALAAGLQPSEAGARGEATVHKSFTMVDVTAKTKMTFSFAQRWEAQPYAPDASGPGYMVIASVQFRPADCMTSPSANTRSINLSFTPKGVLFLAASGFAADCVDGGQDYVSFPTPLHAADFSVYRAMRIVIAKAPCKNGPALAASATLEAEGMTEYVCLPLAVDPFQRADMLSAVLGLSAGDGPYLNATAAFDNATFEIE